MKIGALAKAAGIAVDTVRYYERRGLIPRAPRTASGYRCYGAGDLTRLRFIVHAKELGFTLEEIGQLLAIKSGGRTCSQVRAVAQRKAEEIAVRMGMLAKMRATLLALADQCEQTADGDPCPILNILEDYHE